MKSLGVRSRRNRIILFVVVLLLLAIALTPYYFGIKAEEVYYRMVKKWSESWGIKLISTNYKRGWLESRSETMYSLNRGGEYKLDVKANDTIIHGPFVIGGIFDGDINLKPFLAMINSKVILKATSQNDFGNMLDLLPPVEIATIISLNGSGASNLYMPPFSYKNENNDESLNWEGFKGRVAFSRNFKKIGAVLQNPGLKTIDASGLFTINKVDLNFDLEMENNEINGDSTLGLKVKEIEFRREGLEVGQLSQVAISDLIFKDSSKVSEKTIDSSLIVKLDRVKSNFAEYGPGTLEISFRNIDKAAVVEIQKSLNKDNDQKDFNFVLKNLIDLIARSPEIEIKQLSMLSPEGEITGSAFLRIKGSDSQGLNPFSILSSINAEARISVPSKFFINTLEMIEKQKLQEEFKKTSQEGMMERDLDEIARSAAKKEAESLLHQNMFVFKDNRYELVATFNNGQLILNGQALLLPLLPN